MWRPSNKDLDRLLVYTIFYGMQPTTDATAAQTVTTPFDVPAILAASQDERDRFRAALDAGAKVYTTDHWRGCQRVEVGHVTDDGWYWTRPADQPDAPWRERDVMHANPMVWADLLQQAGVPRNPRCA